MGMGGEILVRKGWGILCGGNFVVWLLLTTHPLLSTHPLLTTHLFTTRSKSNGYRIPTTHSHTYTPANTFTNTHTPYQLTPPFPLLSPSFPLSPPHNHTLFMWGRVNFGCWEGFLTRVARVYSRVEFALIVVILPLECEMPLVW